MKRRNNTMTEERFYYYIPVDMRSVSDTSVATTNEYEVYATPSEITTFKQLINDIAEHNSIFALKSIPLKPFAEEEVDDMRKDDYDTLMKAYQFIHTYGTEETRKKVEEVGYDSER